MISFIILNYKSFKDTTECINSINRIKTDKEKSIIVVDNNSMTPLEKKEILNYTNDIVLLDENLGFAKGNNIGCKYAIDKYNPDFLVVINSDTVIEQKDFIDKIYELYDKYNFDMMGPKILPSDSDSCNPFKAYQTLEEVNNRINYTKKLIFIYQNFILRNLLKLYIKTKRIFVKPDKPKNGLIDKLNIPLHGCSLIFSRKYYEKFDDIFYNDTFLYHEEEFLYLRCKNNNLISLYSPELEIIHKEGQSLNKLYNNYKKEIFRNKEILKSLELLKKEMENQEVNYEN